MNKPQCTCGSDADYSPVVMPSKDCPVHGHFVLDPVLQSIADCPTPSDTRAARSAVLNSHAALIETELPDDLSSPSLASDLAGLWDWWREEMLINFGCPVFPYGNPRVRHEPFYEKDVPKLNGFPIIEV